MKSRTFALPMAFVTSVILLAGMLLVCEAKAQRQPTITTIDAPGAGTANGQGTWATAINASGEITGYFIDANYRCHAFVRRHNGTLIPFDGPTGCPIPASINSKGVVIGTYGDRSFGCSGGQPDNPPGCGGLHAFVRNPDGTFVSFDAPEALRNSLEPSGNLNPQTLPRSINSVGEVTGIYTTCEQSSCNSSFLWTPNGAFVSFDPPNANPHDFIGAHSVNEEGAIVGTFADRNTGVFHGFLRAPDGTFTIIDGPGVNQSAGGSTGATSINSRGAILGGFSTTNAGPGHSYLRAADGTFTVFDFPEACASCTTSLGLNNSGTVVGMYLTPTSGGFFAIHGFLRAADGAFTSIDLPNGERFAALSLAINSSNTVVGTYFDTNGVAHGFLRPGWLRPLISGPSFGPGSARPKLDPDVVF